MSDYMREAERLIECLRCSMTAGSWDEYRAALLAHTEFTHTALQCADFDSRYAAMLAAAPAPDQFRDAAKMMAGPSAFLSGGARYKISNGTVRGLPRELNGRWVALVAADDDCHLAQASAEVPMPAKCDGNHGGPRCADPECWNDTAEVPLPECYVTSGGRDLFSEEQMRTFRAAGEAAGYTRGRAEAGRDAAADGNERAEWEGAVFTLMGHAAGLYANGQNDMPNWIYELAEKIARQHADEALATRVREVGIQQRAELAALRGEVK